MLAATVGDIDTMKKLLEFRADINVASNEMKLPSMTFPYKETALHYAARAGQIDVYNFLIKQGANQNLKNTDRKTAKQLLEAKLKIIKLSCLFGMKFIIKWIKIIRKSVSLL